MLYKLFFLLGLASPCIKCMTDCICNAYFCRIYILQHASNDLLRRPNDSLVFHPWQWGSTYYYCDIEKNMPRVPLYHCTVHDSVPPWCLAEVISMGEGGEGRKQDSAQDDSHMDNLVYTCLNIGTKTWTPMILSDGSDLNIIYFVACNRFSKVSVYMYTMNTIVPFSSLRWDVSMPLLPCAIVPHFVTEHCGNLVKCLNRII